MAADPIRERNQDATIYVGGLDEKVSESLLSELFAKAGPVVSVHMPKDRITGKHKGYGFVEFMGQEDAENAIKIMNMKKLFINPIRISAHQENLDIGGNIFIGNLDPEVDEKLIYDLFKAFGIVLQVSKIMRDPDSGNSKGFAFVNFASFEASDAAIEAMNGQYLCNRPISVSYAFKKDANGERHGTAAERILTAHNPIFPSGRSDQLFADAPPVPNMPPLFSQPHLSAFSPLPPGTSMPAPPSGSTPVMMTPHRTLLPSKLIVPVGFTYPIIPKVEPLFYMQPPGKRGQRSHYVQPVQRPPQQMTGYHFQLVGSLGVGPEWKLEVDYIHQTKGRVIKHVTYERHCWESFLFQETPWLGILQELRIRHDNTDANELPMYEYVSGGSTPEPPTAMPNYVVEIYDACTRLKPNDRPTFNEIVNKFERYLCKDDDSQ